MEKLVLLVFSFSFGLCIGSFLNAVIFRMPRKISLAKSRSHCPSCDKLIFWYENIPVFSYLFLRGRCSGCGSQISVQYPLVELVVGLFAVLITPNQLTAYSVWTYYFYLTTFACFLAIVVIDLRHHLIPNQINLYLLVLFSCAIIPTKAWTYWIFGALIGSLIPLSVTYAYYLLRGQIGLGGGDIKLWGVLGLYLGPMGISYNIFLSCFLGSIVGTLLILFKLLDRKTPIPFGPFIVLVGSLQIFFPDYFRQLMSFLVVS